MKKIWVFLLLLACVLLIPAVLAPIIYPLVQHKYPFERVLSRIVMICGIAAVLFLIGRDIKSFKRYGFTPQPDFWRWILIGVGLGAGLLLAIELFQSLLGAYDIGLRVKFNRIPERIGKALLTGLLVGTIEEFFFRGFIFISLARIINWRWSFVLANMFYAFLHFFHGTKEEWVNPNFFDSFHVMINWFTPLSEWQVILPQFFGLFLFGCILSYAFLKSGGLYLPIGIHAGAVAFLKVDVNFFAAKGDLPMWLYGGKDFYAGVMGWFFLGLFWLILWFYMRKRPISEQFFEKSQITS